MVIEFKLKIRTILLLSIGSVMTLVGSLDSLMGFPDIPLLDVWGVMLVFLEGFYRIVERMKGPSIIIRPGKQFKAFAAVIEIISKAEEYLYVIDLYPGVWTLYALDAAPERVEAKLLTTRFRNDELEKVDVLAKRLTIEKPSIRIRSLMTGELHDRYILTKPKGFHIGHSIKNLGNKMSSIDPLSAVETEEFREMFNKMWDRATPFLRDDDMDEGT